MADEKKRIIDLSELSQEVQVGQYILVDSASGTGKMNLKKILDDSTTSLAERVTDLETGLTEEENARIAADTELSGNVSNLQTALETKADNNGYYPDLYAGNLSSTRKQTDSIPYIMRKTGGDLSRIGEREHDTLVGATVNVNQLVNLPDGTRTINGITTVRSDGVKISYSGTSTASGYIDAYAYTDTDSFLTQFIAGHRYLMRAISPDNKLYIVVNKPYTDMYGANRREVIYTPSETPSYFYIRVLASNGETVNGNGYLQIIDLTAKFGSTIADYLYSLETATAGAGIAKLREWGFLTDGYIPYNAGSLESVEATAHKMVGFNQWDEVWEVGGLNANTGADWATTDRIRSKNYVPVIPNAKYFIESPANVNVMFYNADKAFISSLYFYPADNQPFTTPTDCYYIRFAEQAVYGTTYNHDICINLSSDRNGEYEPYSSHTYDLGTDTLRGLFKLDSNNNLYADGDTKTSDGTVTRKYGVVDLGTLDWTLSAGGYYVLQTVIPDIKTPANGSTKANAIAENYLVVTSNGISGGTEQGIGIRPNGYAYASDTGSTPIGYLVYELATPTTEQSTPFQNPQICDPDGTEEYVTSNGVPVGHVTEYDYDIKGLAEELIDVPDVPSSNGTYVLKATRTADGLSYSWVAG